MGEGAQQALEVLDGLTRTGMSLICGCHQPQPLGVITPLPGLQLMGNSSGGWRLEAELSFLTTSLRCSDCKSCEKLLT